MPHATINGIKLYSERHGAAGEPIVFVHGYCGEVTDWRHQIPEVSGELRVLVSDR